MLPASKNEVSSFVLDSRKIDFVIIYVVFILQVILSLVFHDAEKNISQYFYLFYPFSLQLFSISLK